MWELVAITQLSGFNAMIMVIGKCDKTEIGFSEREKKIIANQVIEFA